MSARRRFIITALKKLIMAFEEYKLGEKVIWKK
jgi:hypothetical protein